MSVVFYIGTILIANFLSAKFAPVEIGTFLISLGTFTIAFSFILRDLVQNRYGRGKTYGFIGLALVLSTSMALWLGEGLPIVLASVCAFAVSETTDTEIYTRLGLPMAWRVWWSGVAGGILDSAVFVVLGLGPWGMGFLPWEVLPMAILGQALFKVALQGVGAMGVATWEKVRCAI